MRRYQVFLIAGLFVASIAVAHHNPVVYDGKITVKITGTVTAAFHGFPHSRYALDVTGDDGTVEQWVLMTEDPRDAKSLGFDDELQAIEVGETLTVVGWPNKIKSREIRGHQLHYPDGSVVMMRRGNYRWTADLKKIWRLRSGQEEFANAMKPLPAELPDAQRVAAWIVEDDAVSRVAFNIEQESAKLIGVRRDGELQFSGVDPLFECHTQRSDFQLVLDFATLDVSARTAIVKGAGYIQKYNDLLSRYWEYDIASC